MSTCLMRYGTHALLVAALAAALGGCKGRNEVAKTDTTATGMVAPSSDTGAMAMNNANREWTDARIVAFANAANAGEVQEGTLAERKATNAAVKAFARQMVADHKAMLADVKAFQTKASVQPDSTAEDVRELMKEGQDEIKELTDKKAGKDWDEDFIEHEIEAHKKVLDKLQDAEKSAMNPELKTLLTKASAKVQEHLTKAEDIKSKLS
jgi:putative membrane protein